MMPDPIVSIIIPAFNAADCLSTAVKSVVEQYSALEVIIVNNNSRDKTVAVAQQLILEFPEKVKLVDQKIQGAAAARNLGIQIARGKLIQFLDADDILLPGKILRQIKYFAQDESLDFIMGGWFWEYSNGEKSLVVPDQNLWLGLLSGKVGHTNANLYRRKTLIKIGGQNETLMVGQDIDMLVRLAKAGCSYAIDSVPGSLYVLHDGFHMSQSEDFSVELIRRVKRDLDVVQFINDNHQSQYIKNGVVFRSLLLKKIRQLATFDLECADGFYDVYLETVKSKQSIDYSIVSFLVALYPVLGFKFVERIRVMLGKWRRVILSITNES